MAYLRRFECTEASTEHISINCVGVYILVYVNFISMYHEFNFV